MIMMYYGIIMTIYDDSDAWRCYLNMLMFHIKHVVCNEWHVASCREIGQGHNPKIGQGHNPKEHE